MIRAELTELERAEHLARRKDIYIARHPETRVGGDRRSDDFRTQNLRSETFAADAAEKTGVTERSVQMAVRRAEKICPQAREIIASTESADSGVELDALAAMATLRTSHGKARRGSPRPG